MPVIDSEYLLDIPQVAKRLKVCERTVEVLIARKKIAFVKVARCVRFRPAAVDAYVARNERKALT